MLYLGFCLTYLPIKVIYLGTLLAPQVTNPGLSLSKLSSQLTYLPLKVLVLSTGLLQLSPQGLALLVFISRLSSRSRIFSSTLLRVLSKYLHP